MSNQEIKDKWEKIAEEAGWKIRFGFSNMYFEKKATLESGLRFIVKFTLRYEVAEESEVGIEAWREAQSEWDQFQRIYGDRILR
jgi:hypothetical protein